MLVIDKHILYNNINNEIIVIFQVYYLYIKDYAYMVMVLENTFTDMKKSKVF